MNPGQKIKYFIPAALFAFGILFGGCSSSDDDDDNDAGSTVEVGVPCPDDAPIPPVDVELCAEFNDPVAAEEARSAGMVLHGARDKIYSTSQEQVIEGAAEYGNFLSPTALAGERIDIWLTDAEGVYENVGSTETSEDGTFSFALDQADYRTPGEYEGVALVAGDHTYALFTLRILDTDVQAIVTDIDETLTISDNENITQMSDTSYVQKYYPGAVTLMTGYAEKGYLIFYLTARPITESAITREWIASQGFPEGHLTLSGLSITSGDAAVTYKTQAIVDVQDAGVEVVYAHGNATSDIDAYENAGIAKEHTFIINENAGVDGTVAIENETWVDFIDGYFTSDIPDASNPYPY